MSQRLGFTCNCIGSLNFKPSYLWDFFFNFCATSWRTGLELWSETWQVCSLDRVLGIWCSDFWLRPPFLKYWGLHFLFRNLQNVNLNISGTGAIIKNCYIRFLELCLRNTPDKFQTTAPSQFFRKWRRSWKNSPEIRRFKVQASYTIACKPQTFEARYLEKGKLD